MKGKGVYLYCITWPAIADEIELPGVDGYGRIATLREADLAAVYSRVTLGEFEAAPQDTETDEPSRVITQACRHNQAIEKVMESFSVLPVRFGTMFSTRKMLADFLRNNQKEISEFLRDISDKQEWSMKIFMDKEKALKWISQADESLLEKRGQMTSTPGARYFQEKRFRAEAEDILDRWHHTVVDEVVQEVKDFVVDTCLLKIQPKEISGRETEMILNFAFLLLSRRVNDFRQRIGEIADEYIEQGLVFEVRGPWAPYNFCPPIASKDQ